MEATVMSEWKFERLPRCCPRQSHKGENLAHFMYAAGGHSLMGGSGMENTHALLRAWDERECSKQGSRCAVFLCPAFSDPVVLPYEL